MTKVHTNGPGRSSRAVHLLFGEAARGALPYRRRLLRILTAAWAVLLAVACAAAQSSAMDLLIFELPIVVGLVLARLPGLGERLQAAALAASLAMAAGITALVCGDACIAFSAFATAIVLACWHEDRSAAITALALTLALQLSLGVLTPHESSHGLHAATRLAGVLVLAFAAAGPWRYNAERERLLIIEREALSRLARISRQAGLSEDPRAVVTAGVCELIGADSVGLCELAGPHTLTITASSNPALIDTRFSIDATPSGLSTVIATGRPLFVADTADHPLTQHPAIRAAGLASMLYEPVFADTDAVGVLVIGWHQPVEHVSEHQRNIIALAAGEAGTAVRRSAYNRTLKAQATTDPLTGANNRRVFDDELPAALEIASQTGRPLSIALLDLNGFKQLNDTEGHAAGDQVLQRCVQLWTRELRPGDLLARIGGDEFAAILPGCQDNHAVTERLKTTVRNNTSVGVAIGTVTWNRTETTDQLIRRADQQLYADKAASKTPAKTAAPHAFSAWENLPTDPELQNLADRLADALTVPLVILSLTSGDAQYVLAQAGQTGPKLTDLRRAYCHYPATTGRELILPDTRLAPALRDHPTTTELGARAYAGTPIIVDGAIVGVACGIDKAPRPWTLAQTTMLRTTAHSIATYLQDHRLAPHA